MTRISTLPGLGLAALLLTGLCAGTAQADVTSNSATQGFNIQPTVVKYKGKPDKGYQLDSPQVKAVLCDQYQQGFDTAVFTWPLFQEKQSSTKIVLRGAGKDRSAAPTDAELIQATKNAQDCGFKKIIYKPHLEVNDNSWRGRIGAKRWAKNNKAAQRWQDSWTRWLVGYAKIAKKNGATGIVIGTEQWGTTLTGRAGEKFNKYNGKRWAATAKKVKLAGGKKVKTSYAAHTSYELRGLPTVFAKSKYLDYLDVTWYPRVLTIDTSVPALRAEMDKDRAKYFDVAYKKFKKPMRFAEIGFPSVKVDKQYLKRSELTSDDVDLGLQARRYDAALCMLDSMPYVKGAMLYRVENTTWSGGSYDPWLTWQRKPAGYLIKTKYFDKS